MPYFALQALFQILHDMGGNITETGYTKFTQYGDLPIDKTNLNAAVLTANRDATKQQIYYQEKGIGTLEEYENLLNFTDTIPF